MTVKRGWLIVSVYLVVLAAGCRTPQPNLKPADQPEVLSIPPADARYNTSSYPRQAFATDDPSKRFGGANSQQVIPARGGMGAPTSPAAMPGR
jgi:hypothetical protein